MRSARGLLTPRGQHGFAGLASLICVAVLAAVAMAAPAPVAKVDAIAAAPEVAVAGLSSGAIPIGTLYNNTGPATNQFYAGQGGHEAIDDLHMLSGGSPDSLILEYHDPAVGGTFSATVRLYGNPSGLDLDATPLLATYVVSGLSRGRQIVSVPLPAAPVVGASIWVGVQFSSSTAGLIINSVPSVGSSHDLYLEDGGFYNFGGSPKANFALRVVDNPFFGLNVSTLGSGLVTRSIDQLQYAGGTLVQLTATADPHWHFTGWSGDAAGSDNPLSLLMDGDKSVTATFAIDTYAVAYAAGPNGTISGAAAQTVAHGADGSPVTAVPDAGYAFTGWSDGVVTATRTDLAVTANLSVVANFAPDLVNLLSVTTVGAGLVNRSPTQSAYAANATVQLTAIADPHWHFAGWSGDATGSDNPLSIVMDGGKAVTATFEIDTYTLAYSAGPNGTLSGAAAQAVAHGADGSPVTAVPDPGYAFSGWSDGVLTATRTDLAVTANLNAIANFAVWVNPTITAGFESGTAGWKGYGGGALALSSAGSGHAGSSFAALLTGPSSKTEFGLTDGPRMVTNTGPAGRRYRVSAWVRSATARGSVRLRIREYNDTSTQPALYSPAVTLGTDWRELVLEFVTLQAYSSLDLQVLDRPRVAGESFLVDDVTFEANAIPDQAPIVNAPAAVTVVAGSLLSVDITAGDPDGQPITTLSASTFASTNPQTFAASADNAGGRLTWTPDLTEAGNSYPVTFSAQNALSGTATMLITVLPPPLADPNLCGNGTFEVDTHGWGTAGNAALSRVADAHGGAFALQITGGKNSSKFGCDDSPNWVQTTAVNGAVYRCSVWVKSSAHRGAVRIQMSEFVGIQLKATTSSNLVTLSTGWQLLTLGHTVRAGGSTLSMQVIDTPVSNSVAETFLVDDVSIVQTGPSSTLSSGRGGSPDPLISQDASSESAHDALPALALPTVYPNPAFGTPTLELSLAAPGVVRAEVYDMAGRRVSVLAAGSELAAATHRFAIRQDRGARLVAGIYFYRVQTAGTVRHGRFVILE